MSVDYDIACADCKKSLWIAQDGLSGRTLYYGEKDTMIKLRDFLFEHEGHHLIFEDTQRHEDDYDEI